MGPWRKTAGILALNQPFGGLTLTGMTNFADVGATDASAPLACSSTLRPTGCTGILGVMAGVKRD
jgi:hypothetical protein